MPFDNVNDVKDFKANFPDRLPDKLPDRLPDKLPDRLPDKFPEIPDVTVHIEGPHTGEILGWEESVLQKIEEILKFSSEPYFNDELEKARDYLERAIYNRKAAEGCIDAYNKTSDQDQKAKLFGEAEQYYNRYQVNSEKGMEIWDDVNKEISYNSFIPRTGGEWSGDPGNSNWTPDSDKIPKDKNGTNPEQKSWGDIKGEYNFESIPFKDGEPDFSGVSKGEVEIDDFTDDRASNFSQADEKFAEQHGCSPEDVAKWREENKYTWHECSDCKTMQLVPTEVHGNIPHSGGVAEYKAQNNQTTK